MALLQLRSGLKATDDFVLALRDRRAGLVWSLHAWLKAELIRLQHSQLVDTHLCMYHFARLCKAEGCTLGSKCRDSHRPADLW